MENGKQQGIDHAGKATLEKHGQTAFQASDFLEIGY
jgi:hypothetical protein